MSKKGTVTILRIERETKGVSAGRWRVEFSEPVALRYDGDKSDVWFCLEEKYGDDELAMYASAMRKVKEYNKVRNEQPKKEQVK